METLDELKARLRQRASADGAANPPAVFTQSLQETQETGSKTTLTDEIRTFIVKALACFDTPSQVVDVVKTNFGLSITRQHVYCYDPKSSQRMSQRWRELHAATRQAHLREVAEIGIAQKGVRLAMLDRMAHHAMANNYVTKAAAFLEQAAKECGGLYENRRPVVLQLVGDQPTGTQPFLSPKGQDGVVASIALSQLPQTHGAGAPQPLNANRP